MTKVIAEVDTDLIMFPSRESEFIGEEEAERAAIKAYMEMYYNMYEDFEEILE